MLGALVGLHELARLRETEITQFQLAIVTYEHIGQLNVKMGDPALVNLDENLQHLLKNGSNIRLTKRFICVVDLSVERAA